MNNSRPGIEEKRFVAVVLAADRTTRDPITLHTGAACKTFAPVAGIPMIIRVLDTLAACDLVSSTIICGPSKSLHHHCPELAQRIASGQVKWLENASTPSRSAQKCFEQIAPDIPILLTTADHALLTPLIVQRFLKQSITSSSDATVGVIRNEVVSKAMPEAKRTVIRLRDGGFCGCNLYAFTSKGRRLASFWQQAEDLRKKPWKLIGKILGFRLVFLYLTKQLNLAQALEAVSEKSGVHISTVEITDARAGVDVDNVKDLQLAESLLAKVPHSLTQPPVSR